MTTQIRAWRPLFPASTVNVVASGASQYVAAPNTPLGVRAVRIANIGTEVVFIELVESAAGVASAATGVPILPNTVEVMTFANDKTGVAVIGAAGSTVYFTFGEGL